jgi:hypothetical protein
MGEQIFSAIAVELQGVALSDEHSRRAGETAKSIQDKISGSALRRLRFDDSPYDYTALLVTPPLHEKR